MPVGAPGFGAPAQHLLDEFLRAAVRQLRGEGGARQVAGAEVGAREDVLVVDLRHVELVQVDAIGCLGRHGDEGKSQGRQGDEMAVTTAGMHHDAFFLEAVGLRNRPAGRPMRCLRHSRRRVSSPTGSARVSAIVSSAGISPDFTSPEAMEWSAVRNGIRLTRIREVAAMGCATNVTLCDTRMAVTLQSQHKTVPYV